MFVLLASVTLGYDYEKDVNETGVFVDYYTFNLTSSTANNTISYSFYEYSNYTVGNLTTHLRILNQSNESIFFNQTSSININVSINLTINTLENYTYIMILNSSNSNTTSNKTFFIQYIKIEPEWYEVRTGESELAICSYFLPYDFEKSITIGGNNGRHINVSASESWILTPSNITIGDNNFTTIVVNGSIPKDYYIGEHTEYVYFYFNNTEMESVKIIFDIKDCGLVLKWNDYVAPCNEYELGSQEYQYCFMDAQTRYNQDWLMEYSQRNKTEIINITRNVTVEVPVEAIRINQTLIDLIEAGKEIKKLNEEDKTQREKDRQSISEMETRLKSMENTVQEYPEVINKTAFTYLDYYRQELEEDNTAFWTIIVILIIVGLCYGGYYVYKANTLY